MSYFQALALGIVQGITEFLPISSSGHLVFFQTLFGLKRHDLFLDVLAHVGTLIAVVVYFRKDLHSLLRGLTQSTQDHRRNPSRPANPAAPHEETSSQHAVVTGNRDSRILLTRVIVATIPTALIGIVFQKTFETMFASLQVTGTAMLVTGCLLVLSRRQPAQPRSIQHMTTLHALLIGSMQGLAITPGLSRSGSTIALALMLGFDPSFAVKFSFFLSIPAIVGALIVQVAQISALSPEMVWQAILASFAACVFGYVALAALVRVTLRNRLSYFALYCWPVGILFIVMARWWA